MLHGREREREREKIGIVVTRKEKKKEREQRCKIEEKRRSAERSPKKRPRSDTLAVIMLVPTLLACDPGCVYPPHPAINSISKSSGLQDVKGGLLKIVFFSSWSSCVLRK